jgi:type I restriction enzyme S subunit
MSDGVLEGWDVLELCSLFHFKNGLNKGGAYFGHGTPFITYKDVYLGGGILLSDLSEKVDLTPDEIQRFNVLYGDVFFTRTSETADEIGLSNVYLGEPHNVVYNGFVIRARPRTGNLSVPFCKYCFSSDFVRQQMVFGCKYTTRAGINSESLGKIQLVVPPLPEQRKIASILTAVDEVIEKTEAQVSKLQDLKKGMMQELLTKGIGHTEFKNSPVGRIPKEWEILHMKDICRVRQGLQIPINRRHKEERENCYLYITIKLLNSGFSNDISEFIENPKQSVICGFDDILVARTGATGGIVTNIRGVFHNNFFLVDYDRRNVHKMYLFHYLKSLAIQHEMAIRAGTTTIPDLNHGDFYTLTFLMPSMREQIEIAFMLSSLEDAAIYKAKRLSRLRLLKKALMQDLLTGKVRVKVD